MKVSFELTRQDYIEYNLFYHLNSKESRKAMQKTRYLVPIVFLLLAYPITRLSALPFWWWATVLTIISVVMIIKYPKRFNKIIAKKAEQMLEERNSRGVLGSRTIEITETAIISAGQASETKIKWEAVERICETEYYLYLYTTFIQVCIIPKRAFESNAKMDEFIQTVKKYMKADLSSTVS